MDEDLCRCAEIISLFEKLDIAHRNHLDYLKRGTLDVAWMPLPGKNSWAVLTKDKAQMLIPLELENIIKHELGRFAFSSGNFTGAEMAKMLEKHLRSMDNIMRGEYRPFCYTIGKESLSRRKIQLPAGFVPTRKGWW
ncbi:MAG: hypothetical protein Q7S58_07720 [Candidatus Binatus sp.]|uniref:PIN-like domain-containing protein n=1 Tax=Candidatus Binatus sp. TaxID=2811406 RepID=UPI002721D204|nr:hypothetical protein [Candidatus Binatus sp.]MDO8432283.1 hypothetical protein [Candidatus Binatus sp.]